MNQILLRQFWPKDVATLPSLLYTFLNVPFKTSSRWVLHSTSAIFIYVGVNWPDAGEDMIPGGLQYASVESIVTKIKSLKMKIIRLAFPIEMVDDIKDNGRDIALQQTFHKALAGKGESIYQSVIKNSPQIKSTTTRLKVFDAVAAELSRHGIYLGDTEFNTEKWKRGLQYMAEHTKKWSSIISNGLRNELRKPDKAGSSLPYNWQVWHDQNVAAANLVNAANPDILIFLSGLDYDTKLTPIRGAEDLGGGRRFQKSSFKYADELVLELNNYRTPASDCDSGKNGFWNNGFKALDASAKNRMLVVLTEFGFSQTNGFYYKVFATCMRRIIPEWDAGWAVWVLAGSYYIRAGTHDYEETWGLLNHDWSDWRRAQAITGLRQMLAASLK
ncbi:glycoside hydrolase family 5 protein [Sporormia fimetaria CBS 119925]|uniref:Glycoside hydrolase family 5 protein n=1 Tax=Sporormia fimetaria CBS 119925 TaxID=1340428 RepID=A0A6A6VAR2_9PLEO|nr:glycoside hydrolase family 5 protein [Sporormia fimetaria CBS 119925]